MIKALFDFIINKICWIFFIWLVIRRFYTYLKVPIGTTDMKFAIVKPDYPILVICPDEAIKYQKFHDQLNGNPNLSGIFTPTLDNKNTSLWADFVQLYNTDDEVMDAYKALMYKAEDIIEKVEVIMRDELDGPTEIFINEMEFDPVPVNSDLNFNCPTLQIPDRLFENGNQPKTLKIFFKHKRMIKSYRVYAAAKNKTIFAQSQMELEESYRLPTSPRATWMQTLLRISKTEKLPRTGLFQSKEKDDCDPSEEYNVDKRMLNMIHDIAFKKYNCTILINIGIPDSKYPICNHTYLYSNLNGFIREIIEEANDAFKNEEILPPCNTTSVSYGNPTSASESGRLSHMWISFASKIIREKEVYTYDFFDFLLDVGSYLGLLIGASVSQISGILLFPNTYKEFKNIVRPANTDIQ